MHVSRMRVRLGVAAAAAVLLAGCGGGSDSTDGDTARPPASSAPADTGSQGEASGTFSATGAVILVGTLTDVVCAPSNGGIQVTGNFSSAGETGNLTVVSGKPDPGTDRLDSLTVKSGGGKIYSRINSDDLPFDITDDGSKVTGSVVLADIQDSVKPDVDDRKQVTLTVDVNCGT